MQVLYINLARRRDRNERFLKTNSAIADFRRWEGVDGQDLRVEDLVRGDVLAEPLRSYTPGALGVAVSHRQIWEHCVAAGATVTAAEDDAVFNRHFADKAAGVLAALPSDWDIVLWGWNFDVMLHVDLMEGMKQSVMWFDTAALGPRLCEFQDRDYDVLPMRLLGAYGLVSYSVSPAGAMRLLKSCFPLKKERVPIAGLRRSLPNTGIDTVMNKYYRQMKSYVSFPPLVWTENDKRTSDIHPRAFWAVRWWNSLLDRAGIAASAPRKYR